MNPEPETPLTSAHTPSEDVLAGEGSNVESNGSAAGNPPRKLGALPPPPWTRVVIAAPEAWVEKVPGYLTVLRGKTDADVTQLLSVQQAYAGTGKTFHASAVRLENDSAVLQESVWKLPVHPGTQRLTLHWLYVVRDDGRRVDYLQRERMTLSPREPRPERHAVDDTWMVAITLELRGEDVIEAGYTYENTPSSHPGSCDAFFTLSPTLVVGHYRFSVLSHPDHPGLVCKTSADAPARREERLADGRRRWIWDGAQPNPIELEQNPQSSFLNCVWVQVSDLDGYPALAKHTAHAWSGARDHTGIESLAAFRRPDVVNEAAVAQLIQFIQDKFGYVKLDLAAGKGVPSAPGQVAARRQGDAKDLVWMTTTILHNWGLAARPVLVASELREQVGSFLPMASLLNHVVLEVTVGGTTRWFDLAERAQGGDFSNQAIAWFGCGLPIDASSEGLCAQPGERPRAAYTLRETILLDSRRGAPSMLEIYVWAEGGKADKLRSSRQTLGAEKFALVREEQLKQRYRKSSRVGTVQWRDDRSRNVCELVETFEIRSILTTDETGQRAQFDVPPNLIREVFLVPDESVRRSLWSIPYPLEVRHEITIKASGLAPGPKRRRRWVELGFWATLEESKAKGSWTKIMHMAATASEVQPERLTVYGRQLSQVFQESDWSVQIPWRQPRIHRGGQFGILPGTPETVAVVKSAVPVVALRPPPPEAINSESHGKLNPGCGWRPRPKATVIDASIWAWRLAAVVLVLSILGVLKACYSPAN